MKRNGSLKYDREIFLCYAFSNISAVGTGFKFVQSRHFKVEPGQSSLVKLTKIIVKLTEALGV